VVDFDVERRMTGVKFLGFALLLIVALPLSSSSAADTDKIPPIVIPANLRPYSEENAVIKAATAVIGLLATAKFDEPNSPFINPPCTTPEITAFYRGMTLMQATYFMFINKMERGFESVDSPHRAEDRSMSFGSLVRPGRELLVAVWDKNKLARLISLTSAVRSNPPTVNADLASYFTTLLEFGDRYQALKRRAPRELAELNRRATVLYQYERDKELERAKLKGKYELEVAEARYPKYIYYETYAKEIRQLLDSNRDIGQEMLSECLDGGEFAAVHIGANGEITYFPMACTLLLIWWGSGSAESLRARPYSLGLPLAAYWWN
jgi:hypothetical protein